MAGRGAFTRGRRISRTSPSPAQASCVGRTRPQSVWLWRSEGLTLERSRHCGRERLHFQRKRCSQNFTCSESQRRSSNLKEAWSELLSILTNLPVRQRSPWGSRHWWWPLWGVGSTISELVLWIVHNWCKTVLESSRQLIPFWPGSRPTLPTSLKAPILGHLRPSNKPGRNKSQPQADIHKPWDNGSFLYQDSAQPAAGESSRNTWWASATSRTTARDTLGILASTADQVPLTSKPTKTSGHKDQLPTVSKAGEPTGSFTSNIIPNHLCQEPTHIAGSAIWQSSKIPGTK